MAALIRFLEMLRQLVIAKNGGNENDTSKLLNYARIGVRAGDTGKRHLEAAVAKVEQLVAEDRAMTPEELADVDSAIEKLLARAGSVVIEDPLPHVEPPKTPPVDGAAGVE